MIDCGDGWSGFDNVDAVLLTHAHYDHIYGLNELVKENPNVKILTNEIGAKMLVDSKLNLSKYHEDEFIFNYPQNISLVSDREEIRLNADMSATAVFTPGHNPSCITWVFEKYIFTGDAYIPGLKTVVNLPGGNIKQADNSVALIENISKGLQVCAGHQV